MKDVAFFWMVELDLQPHQSDINLEWKYYITQMPSNQKRRLPKITLRAKKLKILVEICN